MITFKSIRWKNFLSTGNYFTSIDVTKRSTTLIAGENGAGKSTVLDALTYCLFGRSIVSWYQYTSTYQQRKR